MSAANQAFAQEELNLNIILCTNSHYMLLASAGNLRGVKAAKNTRNKKPVAVRRVRNCLQLFSSQAIKAGALMCPSILHVCTCVYTCVRA